MELLISPIPADCPAEVWAISFMSEETPFIRHHKGMGGVKPESVSAGKFLGKYWNKAAKDVGFERVSLYPGIRHTTVTRQQSSWGRRSRSKPPAIGRTRRLTGTIRRSAMGPSRSHTDQEEDGGRADTIEGQRG